MTEPSSADVALQVATDVIKEWRASRNIWHAAVPVAAALAAERNKRSANGTGQANARPEPAADGTDPKPGPTDTH